MKLNGFKIFPGHLTVEDQKKLLAEVETIVQKAPFFRPAMPRTGKPFSVQMTSAGSLGWVSDKHAGYRYQETHPVTHQTWPAIPQRVLSLWREVTGLENRPPECCLINLYQGEKPRMGLHRDEDEEDFSAPVVSISLGDTAVFRMGGLKRNDPTRSVRLASGDIVAFGGEARLAYHGIDRVIANSSTLLSEGGRINLTLRRVNS